MPNTIKFNIDLVINGNRQVVQATTDVQKLLPNLLQRYKFESNSQLRRLSGRSVVGEVVYVINSNKAQRDGRTEGDG